MATFVGAAGCSNGPGAKSASGGGGSGGSSDSPGGSGGGGQASSTTHVYVGSGNWSGSTGKVSVFAFDEQSAALSPVQEVPAGMLNSFLAFHPSQPVLYAGDEAGKKLRAFSIEPGTGKLTLVNEVATSGGPVYVSIDAGGKYALVSYYNEGGVEVFALGENGSLGASVDSKTTGSQAHSIVLDPASKFAFVPNKGSNRVSQFAFDASTGKLSPNTPPSIACEGGPRHLAFSPDGKHAYVVNEVASTLSAFSYDAAAGTLSSLETIPNVPQGFSGALSGADVHVTPDGKFLYATNRAGSNSTIGAYSIAPDGTLDVLGHESTHGSSPRNFAIHPNGNLLIVGNHESNNVASFRIGGDGKLAFIETTDVGAASFWVGFR